MYIVMQSFQLFPLKKASKKSQKHKMTLKSKKKKRKKPPRHRILGKINQGFFIKQLCGFKNAAFFRLHFLFPSSPPFLPPIVPSTPHFHPLHYCLDVFSEYRPPLGKATARTSRPFARLVRRSSRRIHGPRTDAP